VLLAGRLPAPGSPAAAAPGGVRPATPICAAGPTPGPALPPLHADCGAGVGRVSENLLLHFFQEVDVLEPSQHLLAKAVQTLTQAAASGQLPRGHAVGQPLHMGLEAFTPAPGRWGRPQAPIKCSACLPSCRQHLPNCCSAPSTCFGQHRAAGSTPSGSCTPAPPPPWLPWWQVRLHLDPVVPPVPDRR
jgi:hypothetical protein